MRRRWPLLLVGLVAFAGLCVGPLVSTHYGEWLSGWSGIDGIEDRLEADTGAVLANFGDYDVVAQGQDLTVTTTRPLSGAAQTDVKNVAGVRSVDFRVATAGASPSDSASAEPVEPEPAVAAPAEPEAEPTVAPTAVPAPTPDAADAADAADVEAAAVAPTAVPAPAPDAADAADAADVEAAAVALDGLDLSAVTFEIGTAVLTDSAQQTLDVAASQLQQFPGVAIEVQGHTDSTGDPDVNLLLSQDRAMAVVDYLVAAGSTAADLTPKGYGGSRPVADNSTADGQAANRRVELVVAEGTN